MISLDNLLHEAECLERGSKDGSVSAIGLNQLSKFFSQISPDQPTTLDGRILLAQQGIDSKKTETLLKDMQSEQKTEESLIYVSPQKMRHQKAVAYSAIQNFEISKQNTNENQRKQFRDQMLSFLKNKEISRNPVDPNFKLFPTDPQQLGKLSQYAQLFANYQINPKIEPFGSTQTIIIQSIKAIEDARDIDEATRQIRIDFFLALLYILCREELPKDLSQSENNPDILREMICGSLDFLVTQYRLQYFNENGLNTTIDEIDRFAMLEYPDVQAPWPQIWVCIRAGFRDKVETFCQKYRRETADFWHYYNLYVLQENEPTVEVQSSVFINTRPTNGYDALRSFCYIFVIGEDIQQPSVTYLKTAQDFVFLMLSPHRYSISNLDVCSGYSALNELQELVLYEAPKIFNKNNDRFFLSMLMATILKFDTCIKSLIENKLFPVEVLHILIAFKKAGLYNQSSSQNILPGIIEEFINLLPLTMTPQIVDYLSLVEDRRPLIKFLLSLDVNEFSVNLSYQNDENALKMVQEEIESNFFSINSLHLYVITLDYDSAIKLVIAISSDIPSTFTLKDISEAVNICSILLGYLKDNQRIDQILPTIVNLKNAALNLSIIVLSMSDQLTQSEKERLLSNVQKLLSNCTYDTNQQNEDFSFLDDSLTIEKVKMLWKLLHLLVLFDSGRSDLAIKEAINEKQIIPFTVQELDNAIDWIDKNSLHSSSLIATAVIRFLSYYMDTNQKNRDIISTLFDFCSRVQTFSEEINRKILELHETYEELGII